MFGFVTGILFGDWQTVGPTILICAHIFKPSFTMGQEQQIVAAETCTVTPDQGNTATPTVVEEAPKERSSKAHKEVRQPFPFKVYEMLEHADANGFADIVSWNKEGNGFMVHNKERFTKEIVPKYYNQTRYKSFQRQLSLYGFQRTTTGANKGLRYHEKLRRGMKHLCREMKPVGYKPRGQEHREKLREKKFADERLPSISGADKETTISLSLAPGPTPTPEKHTLPAVVSSNSIYVEPSPQPVPVAESSGFIVPTKPCMELSEKLITTDSIVFFEGMPFYLMTTVGSDSHQQQLPETVTSSEPPVLSNCGVVTENMNGQMQKAWEIGFAVAMTMNPTFGPAPGVVPADTLDALSMDIQC